MPQQKLTTHLLSSSTIPFNSATQHPFLHAAGTLTLTTSSLSAWLLQDRLYALNYPTFIGALISKTTLPSTTTRTSTLEWRITSLLIDALTNIRRELSMFENVLREEFNWGKDSQAEEQQQQARQETRAYADVFAGASAPGRSLLEGMVVLWATEKCYLEAWRYAKSQVKSDDGKGEDHVLTRTLIPNWTCDEFVEFVDAIGELVDELGEGVQEGGSEWRVAEEAWRQVLWAEERFWPDV